MIFFEPMLFIILKRIEPNDFQKQFTGISSFPKGCKTYIARIWSFPKGCKTYFTRIWSFRKGCKLLYTRIWSFPKGCKLLYTCIWSFPKGCKLSFRPFGENSFIGKVFCIDKMN